MDTFRLTGELSVCILVLKLVGGDLNGISNNLFTSTYTYYIPNKEQLIGEVEKVLKNNDDMSKI